MTLLLETTNVFINVLYVTYNLISTIKYELSKFCIIHACVFIKTEPTLYSWPEISGF